MYLKRFACLVGVGLLVVGFSLPVSARHETSHVKVKVQAPLDAVNCGATPPTITVLGLMIDISKASLDSNMDHGDNKDCRDNEDNEDSGNLTCNDLVVGQAVEVKLASDIPDPTTNLLSATEVDMGEGNCEDTVCDNVKIGAPLQAIDPGGTNVTVLGLVVDISKAILEGDDEEPINVTQLMVGQFAKLTLASNQPPLSATRLRVHPVKAVKVKIQAPLDTVNCEATPPTISMLGLTIDVSKVSLNSTDCEDDDNFTCAALTVGQVVEVKLASDIPDPQTGLLSAIEVDREKGDCEDDVCDVKIGAPLQAIDPSGTNVTVLGLVVDITNAILEGDDEEPINVNELGVGQFAKLTLASNQPPLSATRLEVHSGNQVHVEVMDEKGKPVNDGAVNDVQADVTVKRGKKVLKFQITSNGSFLLAGLPAGQAKIVVTRVHDGHKSKASGLVKVKDNGTKHLRMRLKAVRQ